MTLKNATIELRTGQLTALGVGKVPSIELDNGAY